LFGSLFEVTMMDPSVATKPLTFELSIGKQCIPRYQYYNIQVRKYSSNHDFPESKVILFKHLVRWITLI